MHVTEKSLEEAKAPHQHDPVQPHGIGFSRYQPPARQTHEKEPKLQILEVSGVL